MSKQSWYYAMLGYEPLPVNTFKPRPDRSAVVRVYDPDYEPKPLTEAQKAALERQCAVDAGIYASADSNAAELDYEDIHTFVRLEPLKDPALVEDMLRTTKPVSCLHLHSKPYTAVSVDAFVKELLAFEEERRIKRNDSRIRYLYTVTIMVPLDLPREKYDSYAEKFITYMPAAIQDLPWFARNFSRGKAQYIVFCFTERQYFPGGKEQYKVQKRDSYRDAHGRCCKADTPGAVLYRPKGMILGSETADFSLTKSQNFHMSNTEFDRMCKRIKNALRELMEDVFNCMQQFVPALYRYKGDGFFGYRGHNIREYNRMFFNIELKLKQAVEAIRLIGLYDEQDFHVLLANLREIQKNQKGTYKLSNSMHKFHYFVRFLGEKERIRENLVMLQSKMEGLIDVFVQRTMRSPTLRFA